MTLPTYPVVGGQREALRRARSAALVAILLPIVYAALIAGAVALADSPYWAVLMTYFIIYTIARD